MSKGHTLSAVLLLLLSGVRAAPLQDFITDDAVHSVVESLKQVLVASRHDQMSHHEEPDVLPIIDVEPVTAKPRNISVENKRPVEMTSSATIPVSPVGVTPSVGVAVGPNRVVAIHDKVLDDRQAHRTSNNSELHLTMTSISDKIHPMGAIYHSEGVAGSSIRVVSFEDPESMESGGGPVGVERRPVSVDSNESSEGEVHDLMHEVSVPTKVPQRADDIEDVELLDGSVPTKQGVNVDKLVGDAGIKVPTADLSAVQEVAGLVSSGHVPEISWNDQTESGVDTTTSTTTDGLDNVAGTTENPTPTTTFYTAVTSLEIDSNTTPDSGNPTDLDSFSEIPAVESNTLLSRNDLPLSLQPQLETTTIQSTFQSHTIYETTTGNQQTYEDLSATTTTQVTTQFQGDALDEQRATTEPSTTVNIPTETEGTMQETTTIPAHLLVQSLSEENANKINEAVAQENQSNDFASQTTRFPQLLESTSTVISTTDMPESQFMIKPDQATKPLDSYADSVAEEDVIRLSNTLPEQLANKTDSDTETGQGEKTVESTTAFPATSTEITVVTESTDMNREDNTESAEVSEESQAESQETNEQQENSEHNGEHSGETSEQSEETGEQSEETNEQSEESNEQEGGTSEQTWQQSTEQQATVETSTEVIGSSSPSVSIEVSNEASSPSSEVLSPIVVKLLSAHSQISLRYARTLVQTQLRNDAQRSQEARLTVELPDDAFITGMTLESNGQVYRARIAERQAANQQYQEAVQHSQSAAQVISSRNTNVFSVLVSVEPQQILGVNVTYEELLTRRRGRYRHTLTLRADHEIEKTEMEIFLLESRNLTALAVSAGEKQLMSAEDRELALAGLSNLQSGLLRINRQTWKSAIISLTATGSQQQTLWGTDGSPRQVTVEYEVDRGAAVAGDLLLMDGYFVHFFAPPDLPPLRKHAILVLDTSGSMWGRKLRQVQQAMGRILDSLHPDDYFSIVQFASQVTEWSPHTLEVVGLREKEATLPATKEHISKAKKFISSMEASGGTNIGGALRSALKLAARRDFDRWAGHGGSTGSAPQPLIIFLSDGLPTVGTLSASRILAATRAANAELRASIFSLSFGSRANWRLLQKISLQNYGFARRVYEAGDAAQQLHDFYREISSPLLTNVTFNYIVLKVNKTSVTKRSFPLLCDGGEIVVAGRYLPGEENQLLEAEVEGWGSPQGSAADEGAAPQKLLFRAQAENITGLVPPPLPTRTPAEPDPKVPGLLERLWAYLSIRQLLDRDLAEGADALASNNSLAIDGPHGTGPAEDTPRLRALYLALKYDFVTPLTSLIVVKPSNKPGSEVTEIPTDPARDLDGVSDESAAQAEDFPMQNKISDMNLSKPGPDLPISFKPLLLGEDQVLNLDDVKWLPKHIDSLGRLVVNGTAYYLQLPTTEEMGSWNKTAEECSLARTCQPLAKCVQAAFLESYTIFVDYFCPLGRWAGVCCPAT